MKTVWALILGLAIQATLLLASTCEASVEVVTVPVEVTVEVSGEDFAGAREEALSKGFEKATKLVVTGLAKEGEITRWQNAIEKTITNRGSGFVKSYKLLEERIDNFKGYLTVKLQVTVFLSDIRDAVKRAGLLVKKRRLPKIVVIIDEKNSGIFTTDNFLALKSISEETLTASFIKKGHQVENRKSLLRAGLGKIALRAIKGEKEAMQKLGKELDADMFVFGEATVEAIPAMQGGESISALVRATLYGGSTWGMVDMIEERYHGIYEDPLSGSLKSLGEATRKTARALERVLMLWWAESKETKNEQ